MALGLATKFNFLPLLFLPLLLIETNKNRLIYAGSGIISFFIFISPIINKFDDFLRFILGIYKHDGLYGGGEEKVMNLQKMMASAGEIFSSAAALVSVAVSRCAASRTTAPADDTVPVSTFFGSRALVAELVSVAVRSCVNVVPAGTTPYTRRR